MQNLQSDIDRLSFRKKTNLEKTRGGVSERFDRIKAKQLALRQLKVNRILKEKSQEDFNQYINSLSKEQKCKYMTGISEIINLCNNNFQCKFKGEIYKSFTRNPKKECLRQRTLRFEKMLEP